MSKSEKDILDDILAEYDIGGRSKEKPDEKELEKSLFGDEEEYEEDGANSGAEEYEEYGAESTEEYEEEDVKEYTGSSEDYEEYEDEDEEPIKEYIPGGAGFTQAETESVTEPNPVNSPIEALLSDDIFGTDDPAAAYDDMGLFIPEMKDKMIDSVKEDSEEDDLDESKASARSIDDGDEDGGEYDDEEYDEEDEEYEEKRSRPRQKSSAGKLVFALIMVTLVISAAIMSAAAVIWASGEILGLDRSSTPVTIEIPENTTTAQIAQLLSANGIITNPKLFGIFSRIKGTDGTYQAGEHKLIPNMTYNDIIKELQKTIVVVERQTVTITFEEGIRLNDAAKLLEQNGVCEAKEFISAFNSAHFGFDFEAKLDFNSQKLYKMEGYFFPDTYEFYVDEEPMDVAKTVYRNFNSKITPDYYGRMEDIGLSLDEVITLASIVQREAGRTEDMKIVASVFLNRLNDPDTFPQLQSDPTSAYSREVVKPGLEVFSQAICDAYDTYKGEGLPPGAISNPGIDAIEAVLYPRNTVYYYFCSDTKTGRFYYAETLREHEENLVEAGIITN